MSDGDQPKIIVDDDWKSQAQQEKQKLAQEEKQRAEAAGEPGATGPQGQKLPEASFEELIRTIAMPALMYMGQIPDPATGKAVVALDLAKLHIDLLGVLEEKTRGNLSEEESTLITGFLGELRGGFVEMSNAIQQAIAEGRIDPKTGQMNPGAGGTPGVPGAGPTF